MGIQQRDGHLLPTGDRFAADLVRRAQHAGLLRHFIDVTDELGAAVHDAMTRHAAAMDEPTRALWSRWLLQVRGGAVLELHLMPGCRIAGLIVIGDSDGERVLAELDAAGARPDRVRHRRAVVTAADP